MLSLYSNTVSPAKSGNLKGAAKQMSRTEKEAAYIDLNGDFPASQYRYCTYIDPEVSIEELFPMNAIIQLHAPFEPWGLTPTVYSKSEAAVAVCQCPGKQNPHLGHEKPNKISLHGGCQCTLSSKWLEAEEGPLKGE